QQRGVPKDCSSSSISLCHVSLHWQCRSSKGPVSWVMSCFLIASARAASHWPQLWGPRLVPAPTGSQMIGPEEALRTSRADHSQGGLYSPRSHILSTSVLRCTLHRLRDMMSAYGRAA